MTNDSFSIRLREARQMMGLSMDKTLVLGRAVSYEGERSRFSYPVQESGKRHQGINP